MEEVRKKVIKKVIYTNKAPGAPEAIGPYSQAVECSGLVFISGQIPINPKTKEVVVGGIAEQTEQVLDNLKAILVAKNLGFSALIKTSIFLTDLSDFKTVNEIYSSYFTNEAEGEAKAEAKGEAKGLNPGDAGGFPARETIGVKQLPLGVRVEVSAIAHI